ncbi:MAG: type II secretion system F family protein [Desulfuromonadales bacterium]
MLYMGIISVFISVALIVGSALYCTFIQRSIMQERLDELFTPNVASESRPSLMWEATPLQRYLAGAGELMPIRAQDRAKYMKFLAGAGCRKEGVSIFIGSKLILSLLLPGLFILLYPFSALHLLHSDFILLEITLAIIGYLLPSFWLLNRVKHRKLEIFHTLPDILDMLIICVEAGMGIDAALVKATDHPQFKGNPLAEEFKTTWMEIRAGKPHIEALRDMADRTMVDDVSALVTMFIQTERFGTSLTQALRIYSDNLRTRRCQAAEEAAAGTAVKMLFPIVFFMFPALFVALIGPAILSLKLLFN